MKTINNFKQVCVWPGTLVGAENAQKFREFMKKEFGTKVKYITEVKTLPDMKDGSPVKGTGNRNDLIFAVHNEDIMKFAVPRLQYGIRWVEDVVSNEKGSKSIYPVNLKQYCTW